MKTLSNTETSGVSTLRLYMLRSLYLLWGVGLGIMMWPGILGPPMDLPHINTAVRSLLGAMSLLALLGVRYPLKMIPLFIFEIVWKAIWLIAFALPRWSAGTLDENMQGELYYYILTVVVFSIVLPWPYVFKEYVRGSGDRWRNHPR